MINSNNVDRARNLATEAHDGQIRKYSGLPYITHPLRIADRVVGWGMKKVGTVITVETFESMIKAAYLHDVPEDCSQEFIDRIYPETDEATWNLTLELKNPSKGSNAPRFVRKQMDREHLSHVSWEAKIIKLIDRTENLRDVIEDMKLNASAIDFAKLYAKESRLLLECLIGTDVQLEVELLQTIESVERLVEGK